MRMGAHILINGQKIYWSYIIQVERYLKSHDQMINAFYKARNSENIVAYVQKGFQKDIKGVQYSIIPCKEMNAGQIEMMRQWWDSLYKPKRKEKDISVKSAVKESLMAIIATM